MINYYDTTPKADLRKKNSLNDTVKFNSINIQACMVIFAVTIILLLSVMSVVMAPNPYFI